MRDLEASTPRRATACSDAAHRRDRTGSHWRRRGRYPFPDRARKCPGRRELAGTPRSVHRRESRVQPPAVRPSVRSRAGGAGNRSAAAARTRNGWSTPASLRGRAAAHLRRAVATLCTTKPVSGGELKLVVSRSSVALRALGPLEDSRQRGGFALDGTSSPWNDDCG